ncbi:MAG TPA: transposase [Thermoguttaceae bacterium]|nr:transposase [Thermoguttaceae bacterium]
MIDRIELADVVRRFADGYEAKHGAFLMPSQRKAMQDIVACQTEAMGGRRYQCNDCGKDFWHYHGCRNRSCPKCHGPQIERWLQSRQAEALPCGYFHAVVTVPEELRPIFLKNQKIMYGLLFRTAAAVIRRLCLDSKYLGAEPAMLGVLHTWNGRLGYHPHVHFLISAGGVTPDEKSWREPKGKYLIPAARLSKAIAIEFRRQLERKHPELFSRCGYAVWHKPFNSFIKAYGEKEDAVMKYLSRYVFRIAITNVRLISIDDTHVTFRYKDHDTGQMRTCRLDGIEFLRRYLMHVLPRGFHKVRYYGLWHPSRRKQASRAWLLLTLAKPADDNGTVTIAELIKMLSRPADEEADSMLGDSDVLHATPSTPRCPHCKSVSTVLIAEVARHGCR